MIKLNEMFSFDNYSNYLFSKDGKVFNIHSKKYLSGSTNPAGYHNFRLTRDDGHCFTWGRHRLLVMLFKKPGLPQDKIDEMVANHINGIKGDDRLENLELITVQENVEHAGMMGLSKKCIPVSTLDCVTGEVLFFPSVKKCADFLNITKDAVLHRIKGSDGKVYPEKRQYRKGHGDLPWPVIEDIELALLDNGSNKHIAGKNLITGEVRTWSSRNSFSKEFNQSPATLTMLFKKYRQPMTRNFWLLKEQKDSEPWRDIPCPVTEFSKVYNTRLILAIKGKEVKAFKSAVECAAHFSIKKTTLNERIKACLKRNSSFDGWSFERI